ncbi:alanine racemase [Alphaproteobacteria bacterium]|nr:alanine racemase [Alphaproteobacteria bacterium]
MSLPMMGHADSCLQIDLDAIITNWRYIDSLSSATTTTAAMVKANGYGLGAKAVATALARAGCSEFFVANLGEAIDLRQHFDEGGYERLHIMTLHGCHLNQLDDYAAFRITPVLNDLEQLSRWRLFSQQRQKTGPKIGHGRLPAMLHIDTGMTRLGLDADQADWLIQNKAALDGLDCRYIMSHLSSAEVTGDPTNAAQLAAFNELRSWFPGMPASLANSAGSMLSSDFHFQMTRPGSALFGVHPDDIPTGKLAPVVRWQARIMQVRRAKAGDLVGYGGTHQLGRDSTIATIGVGYADGYNRMLGGKAHVLIGSQTAPVVGKVSMDSMTVDVTDVDAAHLLPGTVELLYDGYDLSHMAGDAKTISYEILTKLGTRPKRHYLNS